MSDVRLNMKNEMKQNKVKKKNKKPQISLKAQMYFRLFLTPCFSHSNSALMLFSQQCMNVTTSDRYKYKLKMKIKDDGL